MSIRRWSIVVLMLAGGGVSAQTKPVPIPLIPGEGNDPARDLQQTLLARRKLAGDPELAAVNLGVSVHDRVAILWGPVPNVATIFRAEQALRSVTGLVEVRNMLFVTELPEPARGPFKIDVLPLRLPEKSQPLAPPLLLPPIEVRPGAPGVLTSRPSR